MSRAVRAGTPQGAAHRGGRIAPRRHRTAWLVVLATLVSVTALGGARARYGGNLRLLLDGPRPSESPPLLDAPADAAVSVLTAPTVCRSLEGGRVEPLLATELSRPAPTRLRLTLPPRPGGATARAVAEAWERLSRAATASPYRALLAPLKQEGRRLTSGVAADHLELTLAYAFPDLERALCHPALGVPGNVGPFTPARTPGLLHANLSHLVGRPFVDRISITTASERDAARLWEQGEADVHLGTAEGAETHGAALYATYLVYKPGRVGADFRAQVDAAIDPADLARFFVRAPAVPMHALLPPALMPQAAAATRPPAPTVGGARTATLLYDAARADQRAVAERLQVKLHDRGLRIALRPLSREALRAAWARGDFELLLDSVLLPPVPAPALGVVIELAGRHDLLHTELTAIGAVADATARDALARQRAEALRGTLPIVALFAQALPLRRAPHVHGLSFDAYGLPMLDWAFLTTP